MNEHLNNTQKSDSQSLRAFLKDLRPEEKLELSMKREDYLFSALVGELEKQKRFPVLEMRDPETGQLSVANLFADRDRLKRNIHHITDVAEAAGSFASFRIVPDEEAPVHERVLEGPEIDILSLPVFRHFKEDAGRYITSGIVIAKDPENGRYNMSFHRMQLKSRNRLGISLHSRGDLYRYFETAKKQGKALEIAVAIGVHPAYSITAASRIPPTQDDYSWAGAYMDEIPEVVPARTVDLLVPAQAEYCLEGKILPDTFEDEGPFGEYTGYSTSRSTRNVFEVTAVTQRKDAVYQDLVPGYAWEHLLLSQFTKEIILLDKLKKEIPEVTALNLPKNGCHFHAYLSMKPRAAGQARKAAMLLFGLDLYLKMIIVVSDDVDVYDEEEVLWAVATHVQADRNVFVVPEVICNRLDPSSENGVSAKMCIDATGYGMEEASRISLPDDVCAKAKVLLERSCE